MKNSDESVESEDGELYRLEIRNGKKVFTDSLPDPSKGTGGGKGKTDRECFRCGRIGHIRADCRAKTHINGGPPKSAPKCRKLRSFEVLSYQTMVMRWRMTNPQTKPQK